MANKFNLTAEINLRGPTNIKTVVSSIRRELGVVTADVKIRIDPGASKNIASISNRLRAMNDLLIASKTHTDNLNSSFKSLSAALNSTSGGNQKVSASTTKISSSMREVAKSTSIAASRMEEFGRQSALAVKRFAAFSFVTSGIYAVINAIGQGLKSFIEYDRQLVRLQQITGDTRTQIGYLDRTITNLAVNLGVSSSSLIDVADTLAQAGLTASETRIALTALAKTELAPSFDNIAQTTEGAIAAMRQFGLAASELEGVLGSINAVAAGFAVESSDIITAIQRAGGVFAAASRGVSEGSDALNEFIAVFTSVRATTRESAETIATGLRTIFTRLQRSSTIDALKQFGIELTDLEGKFVGPYEAIKRISEGLRSLDPRDLRFSGIIEELGGFRQVGKVIPLIQQFATAQKALAVAQKGQGSLSSAQSKAQEALAVKFAKVREEFLALVRDIGKSSTFQALAKIVLGLASTFIKLASAFKPILPILAIVGAIKGASALTQFASGFIGTFNKGGGAKSAGSTMGGAVTGATDRERSEAVSKSVEAMKLNTDALQNLTSSIDSLNSTIKSSPVAPPTTVRSGGKILGFNRGGVVPGSGKGDKIPALLEPGEVVMSNNAANKYGRGNLVRMNKYGYGGKISDLASVYPTISRASNYEDYKNKNITDKSKFIKVEPSPEERVEFREKYKGKGFEKFEEFVSKKYALGTPAKGFQFLDYPNKRAEAKFMPLGATYRDNEEGKGNNEKTIAAKNFLFENSLSNLPGNTPNVAAKNLSTSALASKPATVYWGDPTDFYKSISTSSLAKEKFPSGAYAAGGKIQKFMSGSAGGVSGKSGKRAIVTDFDDTVAESDAVVKEGASDPYEDFRGQRAVDFIKNAKATRYAEMIKKRVAKGYDVHVLTARPNEPDTLEAIQEFMTRAVGTRATSVIGTAELSEMVGGTAKAKASELSRLKEFYDQIIFLDDNGENVLAASEVEGVKARMAKKFTGGLIQKFPNGSVGGVQAIADTNQKARMDKAIEDLLALGGKRKVIDSWIDFRNLPGNENAESFSQFVLSAILAENKRRKDNNPPLPLLQVPPPDKLADSKYLKAAGREEYARIVEQIIPKTKEKQAALSAADNFNLTPEEMAKAKDIAVVGFRTNLTDLNPYYRKRKDIPLKVHTGIAQQDDYKDIETLWQEYYQSQMKAAGNIAARRGQTTTSVSEEDRKTFGIANAQGYDVEVILAALGSKGVKGSTQDAVDFNSGLSPLAASVFNVPAGIPTQAKLTINSNTILDSIDGVIKMLAFGGKADGPSFDEVRQQIMDKYPEIQFRISKRKGGFGYNLMGALKSTGGLSGSKSLNFQQPGNLTKLVENADKLAAQLQAEQQSLGVGGKAIKLYHGSNTGINDSVLESFKTKGALSSIATGYGQGGGFFVYTDKSRAKRQAEMRVTGGGFTKVSGDTSGRPMIVTLEEMLSPENWDLDYELQKNLVAQWLYDNFDKAKELLIPEPGKSPGLIGRMAKDPSQGIMSAGLEIQPSKGGPRTIFTSGDSNIEEAALIGEIMTKLQSGDPKFVSDFESKLFEKPMGLVLKYVGQSPLKPIDYEIFAGGGSVGSVPAKVSNGEAYIPAKIAKKVGYAKLDRLNQADRNGITGFASGGISVFKGPGSGTSDSIGPVGLEHGSYVLRAKATEALGFNKGGSVGIAKLQSGGRPSKKERKRIKEQYLAEQRGGITREEARAVGMPRPDYGEGASRKRDVMATPQGVENAKKIEAKILDNHNKLYADEKKRIDQLYDNLVDQARDEFFKGTIDADELISTLETLFEARILAKRQAKEDITSQAQGARTKALEQYTTGKQVSSIEQRKATDNKAFTGSVKSSMDQVVKEAKTKYEALYAEEKQKLKDYYQAKAKKVADEGGDVSGVIDEYKAAIGDLKESVKSGFKTAVQQGQAKVPEQIAERKRAQIEQRRESSARAVDPWYDVKKVVDAGGGRASGLPMVDAKLAEERKKAFANAAESKGVSSKELADQIAADAAARSTKIQENAAKAKVDIRSMGANRESFLRDMAGQDLSAKRKEDSTEGKKLDAMLDELTTKFEALGFSNDEASRRALAYAEAISNSTGPIEEVILGNEELRKSMERIITPAEALAMGLEEAAEAAGVSAETARAGGVSNAKLQQQQFIQSEEGKKYGTFGQIAPGLAQKMSGSGLGKFASKFDDFVSGKGGAISKLVGKAGGIGGIGTAIAGATPMIADFLEKQGMIDQSDPNTAGVVGGIQGAASGMAMGAQLGSFAGPIGTLIGSIGGAIIGGIKGFFEAKQQAIFQNAMEKLSEASNAAALSLEKLEKDSSPENIKAFDKAMGDMAVAQQDIGNIAFGEQQNVLDSATSGSAAAGAAAGAAIGAAIGSVVPVLGTAIGAAAGTAIGYLGGMAADYYSKPTEEQTKESREAYSKASTFAYEAQTKAGSIKTSKKSSEDIGKMVKELEAGNAKAGPIIQSYADAIVASNPKISRARAEQMADEQSALDAYIAMRTKVVGAEKAMEEVADNRDKALREGKRLRDEDQKRIATEQALARAIKQVQLVNLELEDVYRRLGGNLQRFSDEIGDSVKDVNQYIDMLTGEIKMPEVDRGGAERVLGNISGYSLEEVSLASSQAASVLGNTPEAQKLAQQATSAKIIEDKLPALLKNNASDPKAAVNQLKELLSAQGVDPEIQKTVLDKLETAMKENEGSDMDTVINDIIPEIAGELGKGAQNAASRLQEVAKKYNDTLQDIINLHQQQAQAILSANESYRKAGQIRMNAEIELAKTLGKDLSLGELNKPFEAEIQNLTSGMVNMGALAAGQAMNPEAIGAGISTMSARGEELIARNKEIDLARTSATTPEQSAALTQEYLANAQAIQENNVALQEGKKALETLANDGSRAANALAKIQEEQKKVQAFGNSLEDALTASPEQLMKQNINTKAMQQALAGNRAVLQTSSGRRAAFEGLKQDRELIGEEEYNKRRGKLMRESLMATQGSLTPTQEKMIANLEAGGPGEEDPNVKAYRQATEAQAKANEVQAGLQIQASERLGMKMDELASKLINEFPNALANAVTAAQAAQKTAEEAGTPKEMTKERKQEASKREKADKQAAQRQAEIQKAEAEWKKKSDQKAKLQKEAKEAEGWGGAGAVTARGLARTATEDEKQARLRLERLREEDKKATETETGRRSKFDEEQKVRDKAEQDKKVAESKAKVEEVRQRSLAARQGGRPAAPSEIRDELTQGAIAAEVGLQRQAGAVVTQPTVRDQQPTITVDDILGNHPIQTASGTNAYSNPQHPFVQGLRPSTPQPVPPTSQVQAQETDAIDAALKTGTLTAAARPGGATGVSPIRAKYNKGAETMAAIQETRREEYLSRMNPAQRARAMKKMGTGEHPGTPSSSEATKAFMERGGKPDDKAGEQTKQGLESLESAMSTEQQNTQQATTNVQTAVESLNDPITRVAAMADAGLQAGSIYTHDVGMQEKITGLSDAFSAYSSLTQSDPGLIVSDIKVLEALNLLQLPMAAMEQMAMASLSEGIFTRDSQIPGLIEALKSNNPIQAVGDTIQNIGQGLAETIAGPVQAIASNVFGAELDTQTAAGIGGGALLAAPAMLPLAIPAMAIGGAYNWMTGGGEEEKKKPKKKPTGKEEAQDKDDKSAPPGTKVPTAPPQTPSPRLQQIGQTAEGRTVAAPLRPTPVTPVPATVPTPPTPPTSPSAPTNQPAGGPNGGVGYSLTIDDKSMQFLQDLSSTFDKFGEYVNTLSTLDLKFELTGNYTIDINFSGAAGLEALDKNMKQLATDLVNTKINELRDEISILTKGGIKPSASKGKKP